MRVYYSPEFVAMAHAIDATQKPAWIAESLRNDPLPGVDLVCPVAASAAMIERIHDPHYVAAVRTGIPRALAESSTFPWDPGTWIAELASCGGMIAAANDALSAGVAGSLSGGFHHARRERGRAHCIFNGLAVVGTLVRDRGIDRVLVIDLDAHCGGGTYSLLSQLDGYRQLDVSLFETDCYRPGQTCTLDLVATCDQYLPTIQRRLEELDSEAGRFQLCLYYAGMDPHEGSAFGGLPGISEAVLRQRDRLVFDWCRTHGIPVAFALGGGYLGPGLDRQGLVSLHRSTIELAGKVG